MKSKKNIIPQMFDVRPVSSTGDLDLARINAIKQAASLGLPRERAWKNSARQEKRRVEKYEFSTKFDERFELWAKKVQSFEDRKRQLLLERQREEKKAREAQLLKQAYEQKLRDQEAQQQLQDQLRANEIVMNRIGPNAELKRTASIARQETGPAAETETEKGQSLFSQLLSNYQGLEALQTNWKAAFAKPALSFAIASFAMLIVLGGAIYASYGLQIQKEIQVLGQQAIGHLQQAKDDLQAKDFAAATSNIQDAANDFADAQNDIELLGGDMLDLFSSLPMLSRISSGKNVVYAGNELAAAAQELAVALPTIASIQNPLGQETGSEVSLIDVFHTLQRQINQSKSHFDAAGEYIDKVKIEDLPAEYQEKFRGIKVALPVAISTIDTINQHSEIFLELLGDNGPRKYLLLFQNNNELRATGGFIGSYGIVHISNGHVKKVLIDGIFNPDGQFKEDIIPPRPLQKITAGWSTHDANWYPHFPRSAKKISNFYEKTGGPTVDGIITLTPTVLGKMLEVTGPIEMAEYGTVVDSGNFIETTQFEVEIDYDREENKPKKFLADLAPVILEKMFNRTDPSSVSKTIFTFTEALKEKHILMYSYDQGIQDVISQMGWSGEIRQTQNDFLMVVNSNINGYKTDGVIEESITHQAEIMADGTIIDTVRIKRVHNGGDKAYEWWNKVNSNYMRVYVPEGSQLISASGHTRELIEPPLDYAKLGFKTDQDVAAEEGAMVIDKETGTRIYNEDGKTVFGNWVYVSPKETVEVEYVYSLPFKVKLSDENNFIDTYSLLAQKQPGSVGSKLLSQVKIGGGGQVVWKYPESLELDADGASLETNLASDKFIGVVMQKQ